MLARDPPLVPNDAPASSRAPLVRSARFSACGRYRYSLTRRWAPGGTVVFILLNPSTADGQRDDPTIRRCMGLARGWGFGAVEVVNLFAWRATRPRDLRRALAAAAGSDGGAANRRAVLRAVRRADLVVAAWGNHGAWQGAGPTLLAQLVGAGLGPRRGPVGSARVLRLACLGWTRLGHPRHVLYLRRDVRPQAVGQAPPPTASRGTAAR